MVCNSFYFDCCEGGNVGYDFVVFISVYGYYFVEKVVMICGLGILVVWFVLVNDEGRM